MGVFRAASVGRTEKEARVGRSAKRPPLWYFLRKEYGAHSDTRRNFHTVRLRVQWVGRSRWEVTQQIPVSYTRISASRSHRHAKRALIHAFSETLGSSLRTPGWGSMQAC